MYEPNNATEYYPDRVYYAVERVGASLAHDRLLPGKHSAQGNTRDTEYERPAAAWADRCRAAPVEAAKALVACFRSFVEGGFLMEDLDGHQFTFVEATGNVYAIDAPEPLATSPFTTCSTGSRSAARAGKTARRRAPPARTNRVASGAPGVLPASLFPVFVMRRPAVWRLSPLRSRPRRHRRASTPSTRFICTQGAGTRLRDRSDVSKHVGHSSVRQARLRRRVRQGRARDAGLVPPGELHRPRRAGAYIRPGDAGVGAAVDFEGGPVPVPGGETAPGGAQ